ncbi:MAG: amidohydrolase [Anaerolineae bacterium]|nr:amidohydrolase [Anaerolineae bacterium]
MSDIKSLALSYLDQAQSALNEIAIDIWHHPEIGLQEKFASHRLADVLAEEGFEIESGVGQMPTAFVASWRNGEGGPTIGILGEYDALPGLSQNVCAEKSPVVNGGPGHGCGHNLFGTASMGAVLAIKRALQMTHTSGKIVFYGCPAEETLVGKTFMARAGVFNQLDAALAWHPANVNTASVTGSSLAMNSFKVNFYGMAAHAGAMPHMGRSALDGCMLMDVGVNYLREHIIPEARIHSVITSGGGAPNVVPAYAQIWYFVRAPKRHQVAEIYARVLDIAKGAALMSGTTHDIEFLTGCYELLNNRSIGELMLANMRAVGGIKFDAADYELARKLQATVPPEMRASDTEMTRKHLASGTTAQEMGDVLCENVLTPTDHHELMPGSTEVADVSQITPTGNLVTACFPHGTPGHSWQLTAAVGSSIGLKGMMFAAQTLALTAADLITNPAALAKAKAEFALATGGRSYVTPLPENAYPH